MAAANLKITELDFDGIKENIKQYLQSQAEFQDYDFEGSGMSVLLDILAYNTHYMGMYVNMVGNEMFLDSAQLRSSIMSFAKLTNYVPTSKKSSVARVNIVVTPGNGEDNTASSLVLPKYTRFVSNPVNGLAYNFVNLDAQYAAKSNGKFAFNDVYLYQGDVVTQNYAVTSSNDRRRFTIPSANIDTSTLVVTIQNSNIDNTTTTYTLAGDTNNIRSNSAVYFIEENADANGTYTVYFGDDHIGKRPVNGNIVKVRYLDTQGQNSNRANKFTAVNGIGVYQANVAITTTSVASSGAEKETIEQIRYRAPIHYTTQNRAVTKDDYSALLLKDYPYIDSITVWGGEENDPPIYGKVFMSLKPRENYELTRLEKERIKNEVIKTRSILTVFPEIIDPDYTYLKINVKVNYNPNLTTLSENQLKDIVRNAILSYRNSDLRTFSSTFRSSKLQRTIDAADASFISSSLDILVSKQFRPTLDEEKNYTFDFNMRLSKGDFSRKLFAYPTFEIEDGDNVVRTAFLEESPLSYTGVDSISIINPGSNHTVTPFVNIYGDGTGATAEAKMINGKVVSVEVINRGIDYSTATAAVSGNGFGTSLQVNLQFNNGTLRTFYSKPDGEKVILNNAIGTIDYEKGRIALYSFAPLKLSNNPYYPSYIMTVNVPPADDVIYPVRNRILDIDEKDASSISITMIPEVS